VEWPGIVELRRVGSVTKIEFPGALGNPGKRRESRTRIVPVNGEPNLFCVSLGYCRDRLQEYSGASYSLHISGQSINSSLVWPVHETDRCSSRVINVQSVGHMNEEHSKVHRYQFDIGLILIQDDPIHSGLREGIRSRSALKQRFSKPSSNRTVATTEALRAFILEGLWKPRN
jgi:hypothetical protein